MPIRWEWDSGAVCLQSPTEIPDQQLRSGQQSWARRLAFPCGLMRVTVIVTFVDLVWVSMYVSVSAHTDVLEIQDDRTKENQMAPGPMAREEDWVSNSVSQCPNQTFPHCFITALSSRTFCGDGNVLYLHCPIRWPLASCGNSVLKTSPKWWKTEKNLN